MVTPVDSNPDARLARLQRYVRVLDDGIRVPGTNFRIGLDPVLGLIPGAGDVLGALLSAAIILEAARHGVPRLTLLRMALYVGIDVGFGSIPIAGDLFDAVFKVNRFNLALLERSLDRSPSRPPTGFGVMGILAALIVVCIVIAGGITYVALALLGVIGG